MYVWFRRQCLMVGGGQGIGLEAPVTDKEKSGLRGPVRACELERDYVYPDHHWVMRTTTSFSEDGSLLNMRHTNPDGSQWSVVCRYDDHGRLLQKEQPCSEGTQLLSYRYDASGRLERVVARSTTTGAERVCESYEYDGTGRKRATVYPDPALRGKMSVSVEAVFKMSPEASAIRTAFGPEERPVEREFYDLNGRVERRILMQYDSAGRLVVEGEAEGGNTIREDLRQVYRYDAEGRLIERTMYYYGLFTELTTFSYNDLGDIIEERHQHTEASTLSGDQDWKIQSRYQYDDRENWIERVAETVLQTGDRRLSMIERRRMDYR